MLSRSLLAASASAVLRRVPFPLPKAAVPPLRLAVATAARGRSLMDDEAELSDWISDLKTDSVAGLTSDDGELPLGRSGKGRGRGPRNVESSSFDRVSKFSDRGMGRGMGGIDEGFGRRGKKGIRSSPSKGSFASAFEVEDDDDDDDDEMDVLSSKGKGRNGSHRGNGLIGNGLDCEDDEDEALGFSSRKGKGKGLKARYEKDELFGNGPSAPKSREGNKRRGEGNVMPAQGAKRFKEPRLVKGRVADFGGQKIRSQEPHGALFSEEEESIEVDDELSSFGGMLSDRQNAKANPVIDAVRAFRTEEGHGVPANGCNGETESYLSQTRFDECSVSPLTLKGIKAAGYERMTVVQQATLPVILGGKDVLAKARTGTGKTVAFLLPAIEVITKLPPVDRDNKLPPINVVVICPTRELADQAAQEALKLLKYHPSIGVQLVIGGTRMALEQKQMQTKPCQILVATPGRFKDHLENTPAFASRLKGVKVLVLDEADRLLDMGFRRDIEKIVAALPKQRQTLLFSATVPDEVRQVCYIAMKRDLEFINTVEEGSEDTHAQVKQMHLVAPLEKQFPILYSLLDEHVSENIDYKVIVFCTTAMMTRLVSDFLAELKLNVREIHSRKPQSYRTRISKEFKESKGLILVSSDVSARGVDYPDVSLVIQLGVPSDKEQYIHRLGRTGRKGKEGSGILILSPFEEYFLGSIKGLPVTAASIPTIPAERVKAVSRAIQHVEMQHKEKAYQSWLGYYNSNPKIGKDKSQLVSLANQFSRSCLGLNSPPAISKKVLQKMGLGNVPGLRSS